MVMHCKNYEEIAQKKTSIPSNTLSTYEHSSYGNAILHLKRKDCLWNDVEDRQVSYLESHSKVD